MGNERVLEYIRERIGTLKDEHLKNILKILDQLQEILERDLEVDDFTITDSSGSSIVIVVDSENIAIQYFLREVNYNTVKAFIDGIKQENIEYDINIGSGWGRRRLVEAEIKMNFYLPNYLVYDLERFPEMRTIIWERVVTIRDLDFSPNFLNHNLEKLLWDLYKSLEGIHQNTLAHGDTRLDNAGIKNGNFAFYDYDSSKDLQSMEPNDAYDYCTKDRNILIGSVNFHLGLDRSNEKLRFNNLTDIIKWVKTVHQFETYDQAYEYLENLEIEYSMDVNEDVDDHIPPKRSF